MSEVDRTATTLLDFFDLVFVEDLMQVYLLSCAVVAEEFNRRESELRLLHIVVDLLVEVLAHVRLKNHREVVPVPVAVAASI